MKKKRDGTERYLSRIISYVWRVSRLAVAVTILGSAATAAMMLLYAYVPKLFVDSITARDGRQAVRHIAIYAVLLAIVVILALFATHIQKVQQYRRSHRIFSEMYQFTMKIDVEYLENGEFFNRYKRLCDNIHIATDDLIFAGGKIVNSVFLLASVAYIFVSLNYLILLLAVLSITIETAASIIIGKLAFKCSVEKERQDKKTYVLSRVFRITESLKEIKNFQFEGFTLDHLHKNQADAIEVERRYSRKTKIIQGVSGILTEYISIVPMIVFGVFVYRGEMEISTYFLYIGLYKQMKDALLQFFEVVPTLEKVQMYSRDYFNFVNNPEYTKTSRAEGETLERIDSISVRNLSYTYPTEEKCSVRNINLDIKRGEKVAVLGDNGAGKSTLIKVLSGFYTPTEGEVCVNGKPISTYRTDDLRKSISILFQDYYIFPFTFMENLSADKSRRELAIRYLERYSLYDRIKRLADGLDTGIGGEFYDNYTNISGGEKQKLAIIRAFLKHEARLLILDEPMNNLEIKTERILYEDALRDADKTVIMISHRMSYMSRMDKIIVLDGGEIVEQGTHDELLALNGKYAQMMAMQQEKYFSEEVRQEI